MIVVREGEISRDSRGGKVVENSSEVVAKKEESASFRTRAWNDCKVLPNQVTAWVPVDSLLTGEAGGEGSPG